MRGEPTDLPLFEHVGLLERLLQPFPMVEIILATSWVRMFSYRTAIAQLTPGLRSRVIGATWRDGMRWVPSTRYDAIDIDAEARGLTRWLALDDDLFGWPDKARHRVVAPTGPMLTLAQPGVAQELTSKLVCLCEGG